MSFESLATEDKNSPRTKVVRLDIEEQPISLAIRQFARQANLAISTPYLTYKDGKAGPLKGAYTIQSGLEKLLENSPLAYKSLSSEAYKIFRYKRVVEPLSEYSEPAVLRNLEPAPIEEILVSSARRTETIFSLPASTTIFKPDSNEQFGSIDTLDVSRKISGSHNSRQNAGQNKLILRGLSDGAFNGRAQTLVSTYVDDTRLTYNTPDPGLRLIDIEQIEVLRGPQGTLYGSGALSGLYRIITKKPVYNELDVQLASSLAAVKNGDLTYDFAGIINVPILPDRLAIRGVGLYRRNGGYIDNVRLDLENVNSNTNKAARIALAYKYSDDLIVTIGLNYQDFQSDDSSYFIDELGPLNTDNNFQEPYLDKLFQPSVKLEADLGWANLTSTTFWLKRDISSVLDASTTITRRFNGVVENDPEPLPAIDLLTGMEIISDVPMPVSEVDMMGLFNNEQNIETISNETHLSSTLGSRLEWVLGTFFSYRKERNTSSLLAQVSELASRVDFSEIPAQPLGSVFFEGRFETLTEFAIFGEATYYLSDKVSATAGLRWFKYDGDAFSIVRALGDEDTFGLTGSQLNDDLIPKFTISYYPSGELTIYGQFSVGWRLGGTNLLGSSLNFANTRVAASDGLLDNFASDSLINYEIGAKYISADDTIHANFAGFFSTWGNIQSYQFSADGIPDIDNVGDAIVYGFEADLSYAANRDSKFDLNLSWNASEITRTANRFGAQTGDRLPGAPSFTVRAATEQKFEVFEHPFVFDVSYNYVGSTRLLFQVAAAPSADAYHLVNAGLNTSIEALNVSIFVNNLFNSQANTFPFSNPFNLSATENGIQSQQVTPLAPRTVGIALNWQY